MLGALVSSATLTKGKKYLMYDIYYFDIIFSLSFFSVVFCLVKLMHLNDNNDVLLCAWLFDIRV